MNTERLIETLAHQVTPAPPLASPWARSMVWLLAALVYFGVLLLTMTPIPEIGATARDGLFWFQQLAAVSTAATAAAAAFALTVPGYSRASLRLAIIVALLWVVSVSVRAIQEWARTDINLVAPGELACVVLIAFGGSVPTFAMTHLLRSGAPLAPRLTTGLAMLAASSLASIVACVTHPHPSDAVTLAWHGAAILVLVAIASAAGPVVLTWKMRRAGSGNTSA